MLARHLIDSHKAELVSKINLDRYRERDPSLPVWPAGHPGLCWLVDGKLYRYDEVYREEPDIS
jgi:hypothetical protein